MKTLRKLWQLTTLLLAVMPGMTRATTTNNTTNIDQRLKQGKLGVSLALLLMLSVLAPGALAGTCMDDVSPLDGLVCKANDVKVSRYNVIDGPPFVVEGEYMTVTLQAELIAGAKERYDIGFFVALDGGDALNGSCFREYLLPPLCPNASDPSCIYNPINGPFYNAEFYEDINDTCGDLVQGVTNYRNLTPITILGQDSDGDGFADVGTCVSWDNGKSDGTVKKPSCNCIDDILPNTKSKCRCESVRIGNISVVAPQPSLTINKTYELIKDADGSGDISAGDKIQYTYTVNNTGNVDLTNVTVVDTPLGTVTLSDVANDSVGLLAVGDNETGTLDYVVQSFDLNTTINNTATADSDQTGPVSDSVSIPVPAPSLTIDKTYELFVDADGSGDVSEGDIIKYTIMATNNGTANLTNVSITDTLVTLSCTPAQPAFLAPTETLVCYGTYVVQSSDLGGTIDNTATADSDQTGPETDSVSIPVLKPSLTIDKTYELFVDADYSGDVSEGDIIKYTIMATNNGTANLTNVSITDTLVTLSCTPAQPAFLAPTETLVCNGTYVVQSSDLNDTIDNTATADSDQTGPVSDSVSIPVPFPALAIEKTGVLNLGPDGVANPGDVITYSYNVTANGTANLTNVLVTDPLTGLSNITCPSNNPILFLAAGATETCTATYNITQADIEAGHRNNTATADSNQTDPVHDNVTVPITQSPSIDVEKYVSIDNGSTWVDADSPTYPDMIFRTNPKFKFVVNNTGNVNLTGIILTDTRLNMSACDVPDPLAVGESYICFATDPWTPVLHNNTANVTVNFGGQTYSDTDDANYWAPSHVSP